jgi:L-lactate dehydrogenase complex protein LldF
MSNAFHARIREALNNLALQEALDINAERRISARVNAFTSLPESLERMRQRAHNLRTDVITNLDQYLAQFIDRVQVNGIQVHRAESAAQALEIIAEIAHKENARLVAKSKTMVSEEIGLNQILEKQGIHVVETDLGEYIVQLRNEHPAHILTPAVHLRRQDVGETFHEKLGVPYTDDIPTLIRIARKVMRQIFLEAELGISGVNFGVVETGTLCILTNEGNGRMVTSLPPVHIALMGIERLVPTLEDLALMLYLLPRSATGQKLTVYTSLIHHPSQEPGTNPKQRHLVLLDNGRQAIRKSALSEVLYCIRCGACLNACPVFQEIGGHAYVNVHGENTPYSGPIGSVLSPALFGQSEFGNLARASSLCGACKEACPVDIDLPKLLLRVRAGKASLFPEGRQIPNAPGSLSFGLRLFTWLATNPARFALAQRAAGLISYLIAPSSQWIRLPAFTGWGFSKDFPRPARQPFRDRISSRKASAVHDENARLEVKLEIPQTSIPSQSPPPLPAILNDDALLERFVNELNTIGGSFAKVQLPELAEQLLAFFHQRGISSIMAWDDSFMPAGILNSLREAGIQIIPEVNSEVRVGLTGALAGIAETGSIVLFDGPGHPLITSLLPDIHIACIRRTDIYPSLADVLTLRQIKEAPLAVIISGPSRTADIEMSLTIGVHGPLELHVFCY